LSNNALPFYLFNLYPSPGLGQEETGEGNNIYTKFSAIQTDTVQRHLLYTISKQQQGGSVQLVQVKSKNHHTQVLRPVDDDDDVDDSTGSRVELVSTGGGANKFQTMVLHPSTSALWRKVRRPPTLHVVSHRRGMPKTFVERIHAKQLSFTYILQFNHPKLSPWCGNEGNPAYFLSSFHKVYLYRCNYSFAATSAALCLIISFTAALLLESDCCCNLLRCSLRSLCIVYK